MARYVLTQEQLNNLQNQIYELKRINDAKLQRIKELEKHRAQIFKSGGNNSVHNEHLIDTTDKLRMEIRELIEENERQEIEKQLEEKYADKIKELKTLLTEERSVRKFSEISAKQLEQKYEEETLIKALMSDLSKLQNDDAEIENKKIQDMEKTLLNFREQGPTCDSISKVPEKGYLKEWNNKNNIEKNQMKIITEGLQRQLINLFEEIKRKPVKTDEEVQRMNELKLWLKESELLMEDIEIIEKLDRNLIYLRNEIEKKRKALSK